MTAATTTTSTTTTTQRQLLQLHYNCNYSCNYKYNYNFSYTTTTLITSATTTTSTTTITTLQLQLQLQQQLQLQHYNFDNINYTTTTTTITAATTLQLQQQLQLQPQLHCTLLHHTTSCSCGRGDHCNHSKNHSHLSVHQWLRSAIPDSQQPTSPIVSYLWNFRHRRPCGTTGVPILWGSCDISTSSGWLSWQLQIKTRWESVPFSSHQNSSHGSHLWVYFPDMVCEKIQESQY